MTMCGGDNIVVVDSVVVVVAVVVIVAVVADVIACDAIDAECAVVVCAINGGGGS